MTSNRTYKLRKTDSGFSLPELMIVVVIILVISGIAVPSLLSAIADVRLRSSATSMQGLLQQVRMRAVRDNTPYAACSALQADGTILVFIDLNADCTLTPGEPTVALSKDVALSSSGMPAYASMNISGMSTFTTGSPVATKFNARGLPCTGSGACNTPKGYVYYISQTRSATVTKWAAVTVTMAGRIKVWLWDGSTWK